MNTTPITISDMRSTIHAIDKRLESWPIIYVTRHGKRVFALASLECMGAMTGILALMSDPKSYREFQEALKQIRNGPTPAAKK